MEEPVWPTLDAAGIEQQLIVFAGDAAGALRRERKQTEALAEAVATMERCFLSTARTMAMAVEARDAYTGGHLDRVRSYGIALLEALGAIADFPGAEFGFLLHDVGKVGIPDSILHKPGPLTRAEWTVMRTHPVIGFQLLDSIPYLRHAAELVRCHHERADGRGYPAGLRHSEVPLSALAFSVVDAYDAMTTDRPYRRGMPWADAAAELEREAGAQFDKDCVDAFLGLLDEHGGVLPVDAIEAPAI